MDIHENVGRRKAEVNGSNNLAMMRSTLTVLVIVKKNRGKCTRETEIIQSISYITASDILQTQLTINPTPTAAQIW